MSGILYVVATPIGNLEDVTLRALRILREVAVIAAEDTRRTARLLQHYSISTPTTSLYEHNERQRTPQLLGRLRAGQSVALVSDAGTPGISDPGERLVAEARHAGIRVEPIPGPSAVLAALSASGLPSGEFMFLGFPPTKASERRQWFKAATSSSCTVVAFEAPHRIRRTLEELRSIFGDRPILMGRELTKTHEELVISPIADLLSRLERPKGEFTLVIPPAAPPAVAEARDLSDEEIAARIGRLGEISGSTMRERARLLAEQLGVATNRVYRVLQQGNK